MVEIWIPYGNTQVPMSIEIENLAAEVKPRNIKADDSEIASESRLGNKKDLKKLSELVDQNDSIMICIENFSPLLFSIIPIIKELGNSDIKQNNVSVLLANNPNQKMNMDIFNWPRRCKVQFAYHKPMSHEELCDFIRNNPKIENTDSLLLVKPEVLFIRDFEEARFPVEKIHGFKR